MTQTNIFENVRDAMDRAWNEVNVRLNSGTGANFTKAGRDFVGAIFGEGVLFGPPLRIEDYPAEYIVIAEVPGIDKDAIQLELEGRDLTISGEKRDPRMQPAATGDASSAEDPASASAAKTQTVMPKRDLLSELRFGRFSRTIHLPGDVDASAIRAECRNGLLRITLSKAESERARQIAIEVE